MHKDATRGQCRVGKAREDGEGFPKHVRTVLTPKQQKSPGLASLTLVVIDI